MKIKTLIASLLLGTATMAAAGPNPLFGLSPFGDGPMHGGRMAGSLKGEKAPGGPACAGQGSGQSMGQSTGQERPKGAEQGREPCIGEDKAAAERRAQWMTHRIERVVCSVDGTPAQAEQVSAIVKAAFEDLRPMREQMFKLDARARELFKAQTIDKAAFAALRVERQKLADAISQRSLDAWVEVAALFSPEQRQQLAERMGRGMKLVDGLSAEARLAPGCCGRGLAKSAARAYWSALC